MNRKQLVVVFIVILLIAVTLAASLGTFLATVPTKEATYTAPASAVRVPLSTTANSDTIALRLNSVRDTSNTTARDVWAKLNNESANVPYNMSLTPSPGERYLIANITVKNLKSTAVHFSDTAFAVLTANNTAYYSNYAVCNQNCSRALENRTLSAGFTSDLYVLFAVPAGTTADKVVYTTSNPPIVMSVV